jgi:hypothetical protein
MLINNNYIELPDELGDIYRQTPNYFEENEFVNNLMLNPGKYRDFKRNINRINNIENEINYLKSLEKKNQIDFVNNIKITKSEYENALKDAEIIFENLTEEQISDLLSHKKLLSNEKHLIETMVYFFGNENFDWNTFKITFTLYEAKSKLKNVDYSKIKKRKINILLGQLCRSDKMNKFLNMNDFCDSGMEFVYEWVKCQLKIYFYLYQNKKIPKMKASKSMVDVYNSSKYNIINNKSNINNLSEAKNNFDEKLSHHTGITHLNSSNSNQKNTNQKIIESLILKNSTNIDTINNYNDIKTNNINNNVNSTDNIKITSKTFKKRNNSLNYNNSNISRSTNGNIPLLLTSLPNIIDSNNKKGLEHTDESTFLPYQKLNMNNYTTSLKKIFIPKEAKKVNIKLKGFNKEWDKMIREIRTAEMLPLLKNKTFHQMRNFFDERIPFSRKIDKRIKKEINSYSLNGTNDEQRLISLIASGKIKALNYESLFKLKKTLSS